MAQLNTESPTYMQDTMTRISLALGYDGESNQQCWDWIQAVSDKYGNDFLDEKMHGILEHYDETGYLGLGKQFRNNIGQSQVIHKGNQSLDKTERNETFRKEIK